MIDIIKGILKSLGIKLENVVVKRIDIDYDNSGVIPTNDWTMTFIHKGLTFTVALHELGSEESWINLVRYRTGNKVDVRKVKAIDTTPQELHKIISYFINS